MEFDPVADYPIGERLADLVRAPDGTPLDEITLDAALAGDIDGGALRAASETLARQAAVALIRRLLEPLAANLVRASELTALGDETILEIYTALRPRRSTAEELGAWADRLEHDHDAPVTAAFVREAAAVYAARGLLRTAPGERAAVGP